jgi:histidinol-phosphate aminotransferase
MTLPGTRLRLPRVEWSRLDAGERCAWIDSLRPPAPAADVAGIVEDIRLRGDVALRELTAQFDGAVLEDPWLEVDAIAAASVPESLERALERAAAAIRRYHADQRDALRAERRVRTAPGVTAWRRWQPLERVGAYVPGGRAAYASSVLMVGIPASLAGVEEVIVATPPGADGSVAASILAAARIAGVRRILRAGGAQAVAAMALGTASVPRVDKIVGAGNAWVTAAKRLLSDRVAIDLPAGPSECVILADEGADPELVALDLLAQAEHGPDSVAVLVTTRPDLVDAVDAALPELASGLATGEAALATLARHGRAVLVADLDDGVAVVNSIAGEHVSLQCSDADERVRAVRNAGAIFIGPWSPIAAGDYATGTNHVLPTGGAARAWSGIGVETFGRWIEIQRLTASGVRTLSPTVEAIADAEGLPAHAASVAARAERAGEAVTDDDSIDLLRRPDAAAAYPAEPSDEVLAARAGIEIAEVVRADMNTLGGGALPAVADALASFDPRRAVEYGDLAYDRLRQALATKLGVGPERIVPGAGADELIRLVTTAAIGPGDAVVIPTPTFAMFAVEAELAGARVIAVPRHDPGRPQPVAEIRAAAQRASARLVWLCTPNNPTGDRYEPDEVRALAEGLPALVCVDEVYLEFGEDSIGVEPESTSAARLQEELPNLLVLRSLAKSHGLAGARAGYLVVPASLAERFDAIRLPLSVGAPSEALALAALADEVEARRRRLEVIGARERLAAALDRLGCRVLPSVTNFVAFRPERRDAAAVDDALLARGVAVRRYEQGPMAGWLRATARLEPEESRLLRALEEVLA